MIHITVSLSDEVARQYYSASEQLAEMLECNSAPQPQTLMRFMLSCYSADDITRHFDRALRNITGAPMPNESETWVFTPEFEASPFEDVP